jgi:hypothetical protein
MCGEEFQLVESGTVEMGWIGVCPNAAKIDKCLDGMGIDGATCRVDLCARC